MILLDTNVILDVVQQREPHYAGSAAVIDRVVRGLVVSRLPAHAVTTIHLIAGRYHNREVADRTANWLLARFDIAPVGYDELTHALSRQWRDFEDAVVASAAVSAGCWAIITRNISDFGDAPVAVMTPDEYLVDHDPLRNSD